MTQMEPQALVFDWDNTLVDTWSVIHASLQDTMLAMGHRPWSLEETKNNVKYSLRDYFPVVFGDDWMKAHDVFYESFEANHLKQLSALHGAEETLQAIQKSGLYCGIVSNKRSKYIHKEVEHLQWTHYFGKIVGAGDAAKDKPAPDPLLLVLEDAKVNPGDTVYFVGDSAVDMEIARVTRCQSILIHETDDNEKIEACAPDHVIPNFAAFRDFFAL